MESWDAVGKLLVNEFTGMIARVPSESVRRVISLACLGRARSVRQGGKQDNPNVRLT